MPDDVVIRVENLSKLYRLGELHKQTNSFRDRVTNSFHRAFGSLLQAPCFLLIPAHQCKLKKVGQPGFNH